MTTRKHNFAPGPAALPLPVLERARDEMVDFRGAGMSLLEMSHRGKIYEAVHAEAQADLRQLMGISDDYAILFMGGGARTQFALVPMNLGSPAGPSCYLTTGTWSQGALAEAKKVHRPQELFSSLSTGFDRVPQDSDYSVPAGADYLHYTSNNTIYGTQYRRIPAAGGAPLVCDMSSDILSEPVDVSRFALIYAGAQKNMGPAGVTVLIARRDMLERSRADLPEMFSYAKVAAQDSLLNTPPVFAIYMLGLVVKHWLREGGLAKVAEHNAAKAGLVYEAIDSSGGFYTPHAQPDSRSLMNITFRLPSEELEGLFVQEATGANLVGLKGHRSVGGIRASLYNAVPLEAARALSEFMGTFAAKHG